MNIRNAEIHKAVDVIRVGDAERYRRLIRSRSAPNVQNHPDIRQLKVRRRVAVTQAQNASAEDLFVVASRSLDVGDGEKLRDADPLSRGHLIALLVDLYAAHCRLLSIQRLSADSSLSKSYPHRQSLIFILGKCQKLIAASYVYTIPLLDDSILVVNSMPLYRDFFECSTVSQNILGNVLYGVETASIFWWSDKQMDVVLHGGSRFVVRNTGEW